MDHGSWRRHAMADTWALDTAVKMFDTYSSLMSFPPRNRASASRSLVSDERPVCSSELWLTHQAYVTPAALDFLKRHCVSIGKMETKSTGPRNESERAFEIKAIPVIMMHGARWVLEILGRQLYKVYDCLTTMLYT